MPPFLLLPLQGWEMRMGIGVRKGESPSSRELRHLILKPMEQGGGPGKGEAIKDEQYTF